MSNQIVLRLAPTRRRCGCTGWIVVNAEGKQVLPTDGFYGTKRLARRELLRYAREAMRGGASG